MASIINASSTGSGGIVQTADASGELALQANGVTKATVTSAGLSLSSTSSINALNTFGFENRIINGDMRIDQRNAGASVTPATQQYTLDRWVANASQASKFSVQQNAGSVTPPVGFINYLGVTSLSSYSILVGDYFSMYYQIEGLNVADLGWGTANAKTVTLSFQVYSSLTGTFGGVFQNNASNRSYPFTYSIPTANTWTTISVTVAGDTGGTWLTTNGTGISIKFNLGTGSTYSGTAGAWANTNYQSATGATSVVGTNGATWYITGVQLEKGSQATSFDFRSYGTELFLCQRYFEKATFNNGDYVGAAGFALTAGSSYFAYACAVEKRATPTWISSGGFRGQGLADTGTSSSYSASNTSNRGINLIYSATFSGTNGQVVLLQSLTNGAYLQASAEL
jgi:hypothetical protein